MSSAETLTVEEGVSAIVRYALIGPDGPTGGFFDDNALTPGDMCEFKPEAGHEIAGQL
jgi:hypothetical protein